MMKVIETAIKDVLIFEPQVFEDDRGWFMESFNQTLFTEALSSRGCDVPEFVQDNHSLSHKGVLRGLHYQEAPHEQGKLVRVVHGRVWDVAVDIRKNSPTFKNWVGIELSGVNRKQLWIPPGFAHGFVTLDDNTHFLYKASGFYSQKSEKILSWDDKELAIEWPFQGLKSILLSKKDSI